MRLLNGTGAAEEEELGRGALNMECEKVRLVESTLICEAVMKSTVLISPPSPDPLKQAVLLTEESWVASQTDSHPGW